MPYELKRANGEVVNPVIPNQNFFGSYVESINFTDDKFYPVAYQNAEAIFERKDEIGYLTFDKKHRLLVLNSYEWNSSLKIDKFENDELWMTVYNGPALIGEQGTQFKMKRVRK